MPSLAKEVDAQFFEMMHRLSKQADSQTERRSKIRHPYPFLQRIAPYDGHSMPAAEQFLRVQCYDLNQTGFSFIFPRRPAFGGIVGAFTNAGRTIYVEAEIVRQTRALLYADGSIELFGESRQPGGGDASRPGAVPALLIGCRFVRRFSSDG